MELQRNQSQMLKKLDFHLVMTKGHDSHKLIVTAIPNVKFHIRIILYRSLFRKFWSFSRGGRSVQNPEPSGACGGLLFGRVEVSKLYRISTSWGLIVSHTQGGPFSH